MGLHETLSQRAKQIAKAQQSLALLPQHLGDRGSRNPVSLRPDSSMQPENIEDKAKILHF